MTRDKLTLLGYAMLGGIVGGLLFFALLGGFLYAVTLLPR